MATPIKGELGILYVYDDTIYRPVACLTSNTLDTTLSVIESNTKCNPGVTIKQAGMFTYSLTADGEYIDTTSVGGEVTKASHDFLLLKQIAKQNITWKLDTGVTGAVYYGTAIIESLSLPQGAGDEISTFSLTLNGTGAISTTDPED
jgi:predicted secreted protein